MKTLVRKNPRIETGLRRIKVYIKNRLKYLCQKEPQDRNWIETAEKPDANSIPEARSERTPG